VKFQQVINLFQERVSGANFLLLFTLSTLAVVIMFIFLARYGTGFLLALAYILTGLLLISSTFSGLVLIARFPLVVILALYALLGRKNKLSFSKVTILWAFVPLVMFLNSPRASDSMDALAQSILFLLFYIGLIIGGQRILGDVRGRAVYINTVAAFTIIISCLQIPFLTSTHGRLTGIFKSSVGFMIVGMTGVIVLAWFVLKQKAWSGKFICFLIFTSLAFVLLLLTAGRTAVGGTLLGLLILLIRRLKRNLIIILASIIILGPIGVKVVVSFPGFEIVKNKLFSTKDTRTQLWRLAWDEIQVKPWIGWGTGAAAIKSASQLGMTYHQTYLEFAVDHGIPFAILIMLVFLWLPIRGLVLMRRCQTEELKNMANLSSAILTSYAFSSFFGGVLNATTFILPIYSTIALQEGVRAESHEMALYDEAQYYNEYGILDQDQQETWYGKYVGGEQA
jgi:O-antigen ligase